MERCIAVSRLVPAAVLRSLLSRRAPWTIVSLELENRFAIVALTVPNNVSVIQRGGIGGVDEGDVQPPARCIHREDILWQRRHSHRQTFLVVVDVQASYARAFGYAYPVMVRRHNVGAVGQRVALIHPLVHRAHESGCLVLPSRELSTVLAGISGHNGDAQPG